MSKALDEVRTDASIKVALIEGEGPHFSAGNDIAEFLGGSYSLNLARPGADLPNCFRPSTSRSWLPSKATPSASALRCCSTANRPRRRHSKLSAPFAQLGLFRSRLELANFRRPALGVSKQTKYFSLGKVIEAAEAQRLGLVNNYHPGWKRANRPPMRSPVRSAKAYQKYLLSTSSASAVRPFSGIDGAHRG